MSYPEIFIRGIPNQNEMEDGYPKADSFKKFEPNPDREDDWKELSINWGDDEGALQIIFNQKKRESEEFQFKVGGSVINTADLKRLCAKPQINGKLDFERRELPDNQYHGNLLLKSDVSKPIRDMIASGLALNVTEVKTRESSIDK